jgi:hypothetical protein
MFRLFRNKIPGVDDPWNSGNLRCAIPDCSMPRSALLHLLAPALADAHCVQSAAVHSHLVDRCETGYILSPHSRLLPIISFLAPPSNCSGKEATEASVIT